MLKVKIKFSCAKLMKHYAVKTYGVGWMYRSTFS
jgi:hypothetical protein